MLVKITNIQRKTNENYNEIPPHTYYWINKISVGEDVKKLEYMHIACSGENVK